ncbi:ATP-binding cassette domain-containing protein [Jeotgalicoccus halotolerans]|uniref:ABC-2 type transport system ATP-binding protein n=1 Tax=Jeotgalicoccus halotolerans TaxID=157227 RepID=A0A3E0AWR4_9STAP|nr:ABC-2 type transport system ATP-binding protein [Jeotgalicoccus halotolerans]
MLELKSVSKHFGKVRAAENLSFNLKKGEVFGFIGPNGAGKSTTIRMIIGALKPTHGEILYAGKNIKKNKKYIENIAYVPGDVNLWGNLTGEEVINFMMKTRGYENNEEKRRLIDKFKLDGSKKSKTYSKGNRQKVALISAFLSDAELLVFDEPTTGLDPLMERVFHEEVIQAKNAGKTILLSSHILSEVEKLADRIAIIRNGKIIESGSMAELRHITRMEYIIDTDDDITALKHRSFVHEFSESPDGYHLFIDNEKIPEFLKYLKLYNLKSLTTAPPRLEDIFMRYYEDSQ